MKKKKKRKVFSKKEKITMICLGILAFILLIGIAIMPTKIKNTDNTISNTSDLNKELTTVQDVVEYLESTFISMEASKTEGYDLDIYVNFKYDLYEGNVSKEQYFKNFYEKIAMVTKFKSFRIIDSSKDIKIEVKCSSSGISEVKINGELDYFKKQDSKRSKENELKVETLDLSVNSPVLQDLINAKWKSSAVNLGTKESTYKKYDIYFDEGYEIRNIQGKVFNIVFTDKYKDKIVEGYKVGDSLEKIEGDLGTSYKDSGMIGYKTKNFYIIFSTDQVSVYPNYQYDYSEFENLIKEYDEKKDINDFMDKLTDIWPDYDSYDYDTNYVNITYTLKGVKISFSSTKKDGIQIFENYKGDLKETKDTYTDVYYKLDKNLMFNNETLRAMGRMYDNSNAESDPIHYSNKFYIFYTLNNQEYKDIKIMSIDGEYPNSEFDDTLSITSYVWADDSHMIYGVNGDGIYMYNAESRTTEKILSGKDTYKIVNYDRDTKIIEYDDVKAKINF